MIFLNLFLDKERYDKELKNLYSQSSTLHKPKKGLSSYMIFVQELSKNIRSIIFFIDKTPNCEG